MRARLHEIAQAADPRQGLVDSVGDLSGVEIFHNLVLLASYIAPEKTPGGIIRPHHSLVEDRFQSVVGLVLKCGPLAFKDDSIAKFGGVTVNPGEWVLYRPSDTQEMFFRHLNTNEGTACRLIEDTLIKGRIADPATVY